MSFVTWNDMCDSVETLFALCTMLVPMSSKDFQLEEIVEKTIRSMDKNHDGRISFDEFCQIVEQTKVDKRHGALSQDEETRPLWERKLSTNNSL